MCVGYLYWRWRRLYLFGCQLRQQGGGDGLRKQAVPPKSINLGSIKSNGWACGCASALNASGKIHTWNLTTCLPFQKPKQELACKKLQGFPNEVSLSILAVLYAYTNISPCNFMLYHFNLPGMTELWKLGNGATLWEKLSRPSGCLQQTDPTSLSCNFLTIHCVGYGQWVYHYLEQWFPTYDP